MDRHHFFYLHAEDNAIVAMVIYELVKEFIIRGVMHVIGRVKDTCKSGKFSETSKACPRAIW